MQKKCMITIKGQQSYADGAENSDMEFITVGTFGKEDGVYFCDYAESKLTGLEGTDTSIEIGNDYVSIQRTGAVCTQMLFIKGRKTSSLYNMQYGELMIDIYTKDLQIDVNQHGGKLSIDYIIDINNLPSGKNKFEITIREDN